MFFQDYSVPERFSDKFLSGWEPWNPTPEFLECFGLLLRL
jgi:hypothetical protein